MLKCIKINNIALIPRLDLEFGPGLTVLTGETGAGKSILIDALGLVLGERASLDLIRTGEERALLEALFEAPDIKRALEAHGLPLDDPDVVVRREIPAAGKGRATVNGALVPVGVLKELAPHLAVIHGQHEPQGLLDPATHLRAVDAHAGEAPLRAAVADAFRDLRATEEELENLRRDRREGERRREMLEFQAAEIESAALRAGEDEGLRREKAVQANAARLRALSTEAFGLLYDDEDAVATRLGQAYRKVEDLASIDPSFAPYLEARDSVRAQIEDLALFLRDYQERLSVTPGRLDEIEARLAQIDRLKRKYGETVDEVRAFGQRCREQLEDLGNPEEKERLLTAEAARRATRYLELAQDLSRKRRASALVLEQKVTVELSKLAMERTRFKVRFDPDVPSRDTSDTRSWTEGGLEKAEFLLSPNPGEELRPLVRIASGGELSRVMLALQSLASVDAVGQTLVFDEVDAGIGGRVAEVVGRKLRALAARHQVLCVTHLPQIASQADHHFVVRKRADQGRTVTEVAALKEAERIEEIARMLGGEIVTETARDHAREMVNQTFRS
jgi:DNA repair protein RecN (Recombination protein N)